MAGIKRFNSFDVYPGEITTVRFTVAKLQGDDLLQKLRDELVDFVTSETPQRLLLDFSGTTYFSSMLINCLLRVNKIVTKDNPGQIKLCGMSGDVLDSFKILNLDKSVFEIYDNCDEARESFGA